MKYYFIVNPVAGTSRKQRILREAVKSLDVEHYIIETGAKGDGWIYTRDICEKARENNEDVRIFACGGDGTVNEVVNGAIEYDNVEVGVVPMGTGNDFVRNFGEEEQFWDIGNYIVSPSELCDVIKYRTIKGSEIGEGYCVNMFNIGLDCEIVDNTETMKKLPLVKGSLAYLMSVFATMAVKKTLNLHIKYDDDTEFEGPVLLLSIANGAYCGGGIYGLPKSKTDDGLMDVSIVKNVTRRQFLKLFPLYSKGTHLEDKFVIENQIINYRQEKSLDVKPQEGKLKLCVDGEIAQYDKANFQIVEKAFRFIRPE